MKKQEIEFTPLPNPPITLGICQIKFDGDIDLSEKITLYHPDFLNKRSVAYTQMMNTFDINASVENGISSRVSFESADKKKRFVVFADSLVLESEEKYTNWQTFIADLWLNLEIIKDMLQGLSIKRLSIRFVNQFVFDEFSNPFDYFNVTVSQNSNIDNALNFQISRYGFNLTHTVPNSSQYCILNHNLTPMPDDKFLYIFDIDVLDNDQFVFDMEKLNEKLLALKNIRNKMFYGSITDKTISLCN